MKVPLQCQHLFEHAMYGSGLKHKKKIGAHGTSLYCDIKLIFWMPQEISDNVCRWDWKVEAYVVRAAYNTPTCRVMSSDQKYIYYFLHGAFHCGFASIVVLLWLLSHRPEWGLFSVF